MQNKRLTILVGILLATLALYFGYPHYERYKANVSEKPLPGNNSIGDVEIVKVNQITYSAKFKYFYTGRPEIAVVCAVASGGDAPPYGCFMRAQRGEHAVEIKLLRPPGKSAAMTTTQVRVYLGLYGKPDLIAKDVNYQIDWPELFAHMQLERDLNRTTEQIYTEAVARIDTNVLSEVAEAKKSLERIVLREPTYAPAYIELARVAMKQNGLPEGLGQAEKYLQSALQLDAKSANAKVLMGYVYAHQKRFDEAQAQFQEAEKLGTTNLWLWANWGELYRMQKKNSAALEKYLKAVDVDRSFDRNDRARLDAYRNLFPLLEELKQVGRMEELHKQRVAEFSGDPCFMAQYGEFRLKYFADFEAAIARTAEALKNGCSSDEAKRSLGMAYYLAWDAQTGEKKTAAIAQARVFFPEGPRLLYELASNEKYSKVIPNLIAVGNSMRALDNEKFNALGYALAEGNIDAAKRLLKLGAKFQDPVGPEGMPVAFVPFFEQNLAGIRLVVDSGVDLRKIAFQGMNLLQFAKSLGNPEIDEIIRKGKGQSDSEI